MRSVGGCALLLWLSVAGVLAQSGSGKVTGVVSDTDGVALPGATVTLTREPVAGQGVSSPATSRPLGAI